MKRKILSILFALVLVISFSLVIALPAMAATTLQVDAATGTIHTGDSCPVPRDNATYADIQAAINCAIAGDTINVAAGTYTENITLEDGVEVLRAGDDVTTIQGTGIGSVVTAIGVGATTVLSGFTIQSGENTNGGGMYNLNSLAVVTNCTFYDNEAIEDASVGGYGGGMYNFNSSPTVSNCTFDSNSVTYLGGGMYNYGSSPTVTDCDFSDNDSGQDGGGMYNAASSSPTVTGCTFSGNTATGSGGGMVNAVSSNPTVTDCIFGNHTALQGGGMYNYTNSSPTVTNCVFYNNSATLFSGGGMWNSDASDPVVTNCTFYGNLASSGGTAMLNSSLSAPDVTNCILWDGGVEIKNEGGAIPVVTYCDVEDTPGVLYPGAGNINADPLFDEAEDCVCCLQVDSPCIDVGYNDAVPAWLLADCEGDPRIFDGDAIPGAVVDMGADEYAPTPTEVWVDDNWIGTPPGTEVEPGKFFGYNAFDKIQDGIGTVLDSTVHVAAGTYYETIRLDADVEVLGEGASVTTIDGGGSGPWATVVSTNAVSSAAVLDGFTITGGSATNGGGMHNYKSSVTVRNCTFSGNTAEWNGGGMYNEENSAPTVTDCTFSGNTAYSGGGIDNDNSSPTVTNCNFSGNSADYNGGGMYNGMNTTPTVTNCTFYNNSATGLGGGMYNQTGAAPVVNNCILWGDSPGEIASYSSSTPEVTYCDVQGGYGEPSDNNIDADPLFVNSGAGNYHLQAASPCIDVGSNAAATAAGLTTDFDGDLRIMNGVVDMGVDEYLVPPTEVWVDDSWAGHSPGDLIEPGKLFGYNAFDKIQDGVDAVVPSGTVNVYPGTYNEKVTIIAKSLTVESVSGDWHNTIIDPPSGGVFELLGSGSGPFDGDVTISGFTITGGVYGIYIFDGLAASSTITVSNCLIYNNSTGIYAGTSLDGDIFIDECIIAENGTFTGIHLIEVAGTVQITDSVIGAYYDAETTIPYAGNYGNGITIGTIESTGNVLIDNNKIVNNESDGIRVSAGYGQLTITNNIIGAYDYDLTSGAGYFTGNGNYGIRIDYVGSTGVVNIDGNKIAENGQDGIEFGVGLAVEGDVTINNNIIGAWTQDDGVNSHRYTGNDSRGINVSCMVTSTGSMTITNNKIAENSSTGLSINTTSGDTTISANYVGAWEEMILGAPVTYNGNDGPGIVIGNVPAGSLLIQGNTIAKNTYRGIEVSNNDLGAGEVTIDGNVVDDNGTGGDGIFLYSVDYATISGNTITRHIEGTMWLAGVYLGNSDNNTISNNTITDNWWGIYINSDSHGNSVENNVITDNAQDGIYIDGDSNNILFNTISGNLGEHVACGIFLDELAEDNVINFNNITDNTDTDSYGVFNSSGVIVDARWNWWGTNSGPTHAGNPGGTGDAVTDDVDYEPWLGAEIEEGKSETIGGSGPMQDTSTGGDIDIVASGDHTITTAKYKDNPGGTPAFTASGDYYDVHLDDDTGVSSLTIEFCPADEDTVIYYWDESTLSWEACSDQSYSGGCIVVTITGSTSPSLSDLTGTPFAPGTPPSPPSPVAVGGEIYSVNKIALVLPWIIIYAAIIFGGFVIVRRRVHS